jgi:transcription initiation factor TFIIIB Brf1 subunit/transcription initiation factor TFIIB
MDDSDIAYFNKVFEYRNKQKDDDQCTHYEIEENGKIICLNCGELISQNYITSQYTTTTKRRRKVECTIYNDIPAYVPQYIKDMTVDIYRLTTQNKIFRNNNKKSIILACLYVASILNKQDYAYSDLLEMFELSPHEANKGFEFITKHINKNSPYSIAFDIEKEYTNNIKSTLKHLNMISLTPYVFSVFELAKKARLLDKSQCKSVICACIYFWIKHKNIPKSCKELASSLNISDITIATRYVDVSVVVFRYIMKQLFSKLIDNAYIIMVEGRNKYKDFLKTIPASSIYNPDIKTVIHNPRDYNQIQAIKKDVSLPLDDVTDVTEWNLLLDKRYYTTNNGLIFVDVSISKNTRDLTIDFSRYDKVNDQDGLTLFKSILEQNFK